ncbi:hypothetical protein [Thiohalorhabdus sp.]|uniref:hypothetical protein n=1 Tax=Thiohalorhabdus sp. TaxID=3094134 RepID=UPI002FC298A5
MAEQGKRGTTPVREIRELARRFSEAEIENCIHHQLDAGNNPCAPDESAKEAMAVLAKAEYVRQLMEEPGYSLSQAIRELGRRIRQVQQYGSPQEG